MKPSQAAEIVTILIATYPWVSTAAETSVAYERGLVDLEYDIANAALERVIATHQYANRLPTVAEIREAALALMAGEVRTGLEAWGDVPRLMRRGFSSHRPPQAADVADPIVFACLQDIGWRALCMADEDDPSPRARFIDAYDARAAMARRDTLTRTLPAVRRVLELRAGDDQVADGDRRATSTLPLRRAVLELAAHPEAASDPAAQRAIATARGELQRRGQPAGGPVAIGGLLDGLLPRGGGRR